MPPLKLTEVLSFSSEDPNHPSDNMLRPETYRKWKCAPGTTEKQASVTLKLERLSAIHSVDIGNEGSAFIEVLVNREGNDNFQVLLVASSFMTPIESRNGSDLNRVRMFGPDKLNKNVAEQKWDRIKVICTQPFNKNMQYGLSFVSVTAPGGGTTSPPPLKGIKLGSFTLKDEDDSDPISIGSMFARRKEKEPSPPSLTGAAAIRAASTAVSTPSPSNGGVKRKSQENPPDVGFYQLKKKAHSEKDKESSKPQTPPTTQPPSASATREKDRDNGREREKHRHDKDSNRKDNNHEKQRSIDAGSSKSKSEEKSKSKNNESEDKKKDRSSSSTTSSDNKKKRKSRPFSSLMKDVSFVMSGYQNPERGNLRDLMLEMGARYKPEWGSSCTHLICAFTNTPKYQQVKGRGRIVTAKWVTDCHKKKIRYPCRRYALEKRSDQGGAESEEEIWAEEILPKEDVKPVSKPSAAPSHSSGASNSTTVPGTDDSGNNTDVSDNEDTDDEIERALAAQKKGANDSKAPQSAKSSKQEEEIKEEKAVTKPKTNQSQNTLPVNGSGEVSRKTETSKDEQTLNVKEERRKQNGLKDEEEDDDDDVFDADTDVDEENIKNVERPDTSSLPLPSLGDYLHGKIFFLYGSMADSKKKLLHRYITAFDGSIEEYMTDNVQFVVTEEEWDDNFEEALNDNPNIQFVKPSWIWRCSDKQKLVPHQPYLVVPRE